MAIDPTGDILLPPQSPVPRPYQIEDAIRTADQTGTLLAHQMGLGKTAIAIMAASKIRPERALVICPASLRLNWAEEIRKWSALSGDIQIITKRTEEIDLSARWVIISYNLLSRVILPQEWPLIIADEVHAHLKNPKSLRSKAFRGLEAERDIMLSGTPIESRPRDLWPIVQRLDPGPSGLGFQWWPFVRRYCAAFWEDIWVKGGKKKKVLNTSGASRIDELQDKLSRFMIRRLKRDVAQQLPEKTHQVVTLMPPAKFRATLKRHSQEYEKFLAALKNTGDSPEVPFSQMSEQRRIEGEAKTKHIIEHLQSVAGPTLVFAHHREVLKGLYAGLKDRNPAYIVGGMKDTDRQENVKKFMSGQTDVILLSIRAAAVGLNLQRAENVVLAELDWNPSWINQAIDRAHRIGGTQNKILIQYLVWEFGLDQRMMELLQEKQEIADRVIGDSE